MEVSVHLAPHAVGRGIGGLLDESLFAALATEPAIGEDVTGPGRSGG